MSIWQFLARLRIDSQREIKDSFILGEYSKNEQVTNSSAQEDLIPNDQLFDSQAVSHSNDLSNDPLYPLWIKLTPREQLVTALTCERYTDAQMAAVLSLSKFTIRTYLEKVLIRFDLQSKADLRVMFANWNFSQYKADLLASMKSNGTET